MLLVVWLVVWVLGLFWAGVGFSLRYCLWLLVIVVLCIVFVFGLFCLVVG